ncbi:MAG TPA: glutamine-hydrolyzing GMP synthase, partial [Pyrinomonadaceae bacterium]|nr:glutamine-hydrolyzing GMP synthase [Pyrinomonadaceae bacterium]
MHRTIAIVDLGGQYCHLIGKQLRRLGVGSKIYGPEIRSKDLSKHAGIILSGGPQSVYEKDAPKTRPEILDIKVPILGICYGHQLLAQMLGAKVNKGDGEYGPTRLSVVAHDTLFRGTPDHQIVWMSHTDTVSKLPAQLTTLASTRQCPTAAFADIQRRFYGVQFHPEVVHTENGLKILRTFVSSVCGLRTHKNVKYRIKPLVEKIRARIGEKSVFFLVSGGVDSTVAFVLCAKALPKERILGLYVNTGLMRKRETEELQANLARLGLLDRLQTRDRSIDFLKSLRGVTNPETKRQIIGRLFVRVQSEVMLELGIDDQHWLLGQGTIYPDTIESGGMRGLAAVIKTHHNRCPEILEMIEKGRVIEPLSELYKDEVRELGEAIGLESSLTNKWPFPGPGLAIRCLCSRSAAKARKIGDALRKFVPESEYETVLLPIKSVGVQGDARTYRKVVALRDGGDEIDYEKLQRLSTELCNVHTATNRVVVLISGRVKSLE